VRVDVCYFAAFREAAGTSGESLDTTAATPAALFDECARNHAGLRRFTASLVAVNDEMCDWERPLADGDRVLFFPPVAGG